MLVHHLGALDFVWEKTTQQVEALLYLHRSFVGLQVGLCEMSYGLAQQGAPLLRGIVRRG